MILLGYLDSLQIRRKTMFSCKESMSSAFLQTLLGFKLGFLHVRYLGVPLIATRLNHSDCMPLVDWILFRNKLWTSTSLTYIRRLQLIKFSPFLIQVY